MYIFSFRFDTISLSNRRFAFLRCVQSLMKILFICNFCTQSSVKYTSMRDIPIWSAWILLFEFLNFRTIVRALMLSLCGHRKICPSMCRDKSLRSSIENSVIVFALVHVHRVTNRVTSAHFNILISACLSFNVKTYTVTSIGWRNNDYISFHSFRSGCSMNA